MGETTTESKEDISKMFTGKSSNLNSDEELAMNIIHRFNICSDTLDTMPAFDEHLETLFLRRKNK